MGTMRTKIREIRIRKRKKIHDISITLGLRKRQKNRRRFSSNPERRRTANLEEYEKPAIPTGQKIPAISKGGRSAAGCHHSCQFHQPIR